MTDDYGSRTVEDNRMELYLSLEAERLYEELLGESPGEDEDVYPTAVGLNHVMKTRTGIQTVEEDISMVGLKVMDEPGYEASGFCWDRDVVDTFTQVETWFERESLYDADERGDCVVHTHDVPVDVLLQDVRGATIVVDYTTNTQTADNLSCRVRLVYGLPWNPVSEQYCAVTVITNHLPESVKEVLSVVELAFRRDPVHDIPICLFDDFDQHIEDGANDGEPA